jgi:hypothetical protein
MIEKDMRRRQRGMAAEINLDCRCKPAKLERFPFANKESRFGQIIFSADTLHDMFIEPLFQRADRRGISPE